MICSREKIIFVFKNNSKRYNFSQNRDKMFGFFAICLFLKNIIRKATKKNFPNIPIHGNQFFYNNVLSNKYLLKLKVRK